jgi:carbamoyltransferase
LTAVLGISALYHDAAAALIIDGVVVAAAQEERFSRVKHDPSLPVRATRWCLGQAGIRIEDVDHIVFYEKPLRKFERILNTTVATFPRSIRAFPRTMRTWLGEKVWTRSIIAEGLGVDPKRIMFSEHHLSHAASAFLCSPHKRAAILTVDGVGEHATTSLWRGIPDAPFIEPVAEVRFPHSLGLFYSAMTAYLGFAVNEGEYKVMGMAAYGQPRFRDEMSRLLRIDDNGGYSLDLDYFCFHWHHAQSYTPKLVALLGPPRYPGTPFVPEGAPSDASADEIAASQHYADIAASAQAALEDALLALARYAKTQVDADALCLAGGVALNSVANQRLAQEAPFNHLWVQPAAGDAGGALGAALWAWHCVLGHPRTGPLDRFDLGEQFSRGEIGDLLVDLRLPREELPEDEVAHRAAEDLAAGSVLGWFDGRSEFGPRALGHRSILADPRTPAMKERVNERIKYREAFRPFAPSFLSEKIHEWVDSPPAAALPLRFMLTTPQVRPDKAEELGAVVHIDGSTRAQSVRAVDHPRYHALIQRFGDLTGVPAVLNTSFNLKGDPMVASPAQAVATFLSSELDVLYLQGFRVTRKT